MRAPCAPGEAGQVALTFENPTISGVALVNSVYATGNPDDGTQQFSAESAPSNALVPTQQ